MARESVEEKRRLGETPSTKEHEDLQAVNKAIKRRNKQMKETGQIGPHGKGKKMKKSPAQMWPYPEKEYVKSGVNGLSYKENMISLLYEFAEEVMDQNPGAHQKASRLCEQERLD